MAWMYVLIAGVCEILWATGLKYTDGFTRLWPSVGTVLAMAASFWFLANSLRAIPLGTAYAVWTGIGAAGMALVGILFFDESREPLRLLCLLLVVAGIIGLKFTAPE
jgi:quaternary ammonium compound-resistance protein SugE